MGRVEGKVALITGAARGQGRSHAVRLAEEGADIIAVDACADVASNGYPLATPDDLAETARQVEKAGRRVIARQADVRDPAGLRALVAEAVSELGGLHIVVANAGIAPLGPGPVQAFADVVDINLGGTLNTVHAALPYLRAGASVIATGSVAAFLPGTTDTDAGGPGGAGYGLAKRVVAQYINDLAVQLAPRSIRANAVHPANCNTDMLQSDPMYRMFRPDLDQPTREDAEPAFHAMQAMPIPYVEPLDVSHAVLFLASDESRYVTGLQLKVDAGAVIKVQPWRQ
ncbi:mycofactocin-coupled SDR family oxidoreductase [Streptomyces sp. NPDC048254]|uniref:mycofactocin-coupled SDR family oxidoreductase n=1 Tax=Streptomyces sp. NPDC048254 TaxID=3365525 RepID=UPI003717527D